MREGFFEKLFDRNTGMVLDVIAAGTSDAPATKERLKARGIPDEQLHDSLSKLLNWEIIQQFHPTDEPVFWMLNNCTPMGQAFKRIQDVQDTTPKACAPPA